MAIAPVSGNASGNFGRAVISLLLRAVRTGPGTTPRPLPPAGIRGRARSPRGGEPRTVLSSMASPWPVSGGHSPPIHRTKQTSDCSGSSAANTRPKISCDVMPCVSGTGWPSRSGFAWPNRPIPARPTAPASMAHRATRSLSVRPCLGVPLRELICRQPGNHANKRATVERVNIPNVLNRQFDVAASNPVRCGDITYVWAQGRRHYLGGGPDPFTRCRPVILDASTHRRMDALTMVKAFAPVHPGPSRPGSCQISNPRGRLDFACLKEAFDRGVPAHMGTPGHSDCGRESGCRRPRCPTRLPRPDGHFPPAWGRGRQYARHPG
jgi:putative transposase